ncbi:DNA repair protein RecO [Reichenbachiella carrageenanivorans]|uniref:DNA repair protein RecO n=1 Tax=Reichenbachiella carrageenanivorans TaxID=2979869 RepID=A0ABY6D3K1_9BACT|nr:DNA repair protein RecO [Reichenbachiella carrageenanivorans]UXX80205.1 DNA repair protein RecO [Reichenbachiella carrageenanivorans]
MLHKTRGIVLNYIKYRETSIIARIYTESFGIQSYIINSVRSQRSKKGLALLQPLTVLDMVVYFKNQKSDGLQRISEYKPAHSFTSIPFDVKKSAMALFVTELLTKVLKEEDDRGQVFEFLFQFILMLDQKRDGYESLHLYLMVQLTHYIGFGVHHKKELQNDGLLHEVSTSYEEIYEAVLTMNANHLSDVVEMNNLLRRDVLNYLIEYYKLHVIGFKELKSLDVLAQIFR